MQSLMQLLMQLPECRAILELQRRPPPDVAAFSVARRALLRRDEGGEPVAQRMAPGAPLRHGRAQKVNAPQ